MTAKLLILLKRLLNVSSKCALKSLNNQADFDSAIRRFDPSRPSQASDDITGQGQRNGQYCQRLCAGGWQ